MFALIGVLGLLVFVLARPTDLFPSLKSLPFLYGSFALAVLGLLVDLRLGFAKVRRSPVVVLALAYLGWCMVTVVLKSAWAVSRSIVELGIIAAVFLVISQGVSSFRAYQTVVATLLATILFIAGVSAHQGTQPRYCVAIDPGDHFTSMGRPDSRRCSEVPPCRIDPPEPQSLYRCEHVGLFGLTSIGGRVRYTGVLHDPNEVALTCAAALPFAIAFFRRRRSRWRFGFALLAFFLVSAAVVYSKSRGGLLVLVTAVGVYFFERYRYKGVFVGGLLLSPVLLLGGRSGAKASASTTERLECWYEGLSMFLSNPGLGVGYGNFTEYHHLTAHNSVVLAGAETGYVGLVLWSLLMYAALKIPLRGRLTLTGEGAAVARDWSLATFSALAAATVGAFFLSFNYHYVLWTYLALSAALYNAIRRHRPHFEVKLNLFEVGAISVFTMGLMVVLRLYTGIRLASG
ncbi:MAG: O-antigen ligase family protein [Myxococcota bacterium]